MKHPPRNPRRRLLILDDDPALGRFVGTVAERSGLDATITTTAHDFSAALDQAFDLVVLDLLVPDADGVELMRSLADRPYRPKVILVSGLADRVLAGAARVAEEMGLTVRGRLHKPFRAHELRELFDLGPVAPVAVDAPWPATAPTPPVPAAPTHAAITRADLRRAIVRDELALQYQPQVSLVDGAFAGAEALVRWHHPERGLLQPAAFLDLVDDDLLASELTLWVIRRAVREWTAVRARLELDVGLSVNIHPAALSDPAFAALAVLAAESPALPSTALMLEVTEVAPADPAVSLGTMTRLRMRGFGLSIDDFGTGHSSLERLNRVPFTELKVDRGFVREVMTNDWARTIAAQSITLGRALGLRTVAEGIDDPAALAWLQRAGCEFAQGFLMARPMWPDDLDRWAAEWAVSEVKYALLVGASAAAAAVSGAPAQGPVSARGTVA